MTDDSLSLKAQLRHEIANALAIVQANVEGMLDGVLEPTPERMESLSEAFAGITNLLERWSRTS